MGIVLFLLMQLSFVSGNVDTNPTADTTRNVVIPDIEEL